MFHLRRISRLHRELSRYRQSIKSKSLQLRFNSQNSKSNSNNSHKPLGPSEIFANGVLSKTIIFTSGAVFGAYLYQQDAKELNKPNYNGKSVLSLEELDSPNYADNKTIELGINKIKQIFKRNTKSDEIYDESLLVTNTKEELDAHADTYFNTHHASKDERSKYVIYPRLTEEVSEIMKICYELSIPVVPTGGRSSLEGHFIPTRGGITLDLSNMDQIIKLNEKDLDINVQGGIGWETLKDYLDDYNLLFSVDPGPSGVISGGLACNSSGTQATRYGEAYKNVLNLTVVLADGTIIKTKQRPKKSSAGYNLNSLFIGSEGTLGIITEATLKLHVKPKIERVAVIPFKTIKDAAESVNSYILNGIQLNAIELLDDKMMKCINESGETSRKWTELPTLFLKIGGSNDDVVKSLINQVKLISSSHNSVDFKFASSIDETTELWSARKVALWSTINQGKLKDENIQLWTTDAVVPISCLPNFLVETKDDIDSSGLSNTLVAHIGDGNAHSFILYNPLERSKAEHVVHNMVRRAIAYEGTCTGEHGIGYGKRDFLVEEIGELPVDLMRKIKLSLDPKRIMNPDKIFKIDPNEPIDDNEHGDIHKETLDVKHVK